MLDRVSAALGNLQSSIEEEQCQILLTPVMGQFVELFEWEGVASYPILQAVHGILVEWLLKPCTTSVKVSTNPNLYYVLHPIPIDSGAGLLIEEWRNETGKLYSLHYHHCGGNFCVGVACDFAFAGLPKGDYESPTPNERFPLVGPADLAVLADFEEWDVPNDINQRPVSYSEARRNISALNGEVADEAEGSHYKVTFPGARRPWPLDYNVDPIPDRFIGQLPALCGFPEDVVRYTLIFGALPPRKRKF